jgi:hypothetical protein
MPASCVYTSLRSTPKNLSYVEDHSNVPASCVHTSLVYTRESILRRRPFKHLCVLCPHLLGLHQRIHLTQKTIQTCLLPVSIPSWSTTKDLYYVEDHSNVPASCATPPLSKPKNPTYVEDHSNMPASCVHTTEYTEWQRPLSGVHSFM